MDIATIIGLIAGVALMLWAVMSKSELSNFVDASSLVMVLGGATCAALISFPLRNVMGIAKVVRKTLFAKSADPKQLIQDLVGYAEIARRDGILALEDTVRNVDDKFIVTGIQMAIDGTDPEVIEQILISEWEAVAERHADGKALFDNLGKYAPAFGMIGTLVGLVIMLKNMDDPSSIGDGMAIALLTTLYGALASNLVAMPLADKLGVRSKEELLLKSIVIKGVMAIQSGDNPRVVEQKLLTFLPYRQRPNPDDAKSEAA